MYEEEIRKNFPTILSNYMYALFPDFPGKNPCPNKIARVRVLFRQFGHAYGLTEIERPTGIDTVSPTSQCHQHNHVTDNLFPVKSL